MTSTDDDTTEAPAVTPADPAETTRRFRILDDAGETAAHGVVFPPPSCYAVLVWTDPVAMEHRRELNGLLDEYGDRVEWVDKTVHQLAGGTFVGEGSSPYGDDD